jgi:hypothetical protein
MKIYPRIKPSKFVGNQIAYMAHLMRHAKNQASLLAESIVEGVDLQASVCEHSIDLILWEADRNLTAAQCEIIKRALSAHIVRVQRFHFGNRLP